MCVGDLVQNTKEKRTTSTKIGIIIAENQHYYAVKWLFVPKGLPDHDLKCLYGLSITQHYYKTNNPLSIYKVKNVLGND